MVYFWTPEPIGLKADIERHRAEQQKLEQKITEIESLPITDASKRFLRAYRNTLCILLVSKAQVAERIGKE